MNPNSIVDYLKSQGQDPSFDARANAPTYPTYTNDNPIYDNSDDDFYGKGVGAGGYIKLKL